MSLIDDTCAAIAEPSAEAAAAAQHALDAKTKPRRSLGRLEELACRVAALRGTALPALPRKAIVVMAADHGVAQEGVSAYPQQVTGQMLLNFARGGAAINVLARQADARVVVVDMGVAHVPPDLGPGVRNLSIAPGTQSFVRGPAMSRAQAELAVEHGIRLAAGLAGEGVTLLGIGEMGIGNTTAASAITAVLTRSAVLDVVGRGTGIGPATLQRKVEVIARALALHAPAADDPLGVLAALGGFEIAGLCGVVLGAAAVRVPVVMDGFIASAAALIAARLCPRAGRYLIASHRSAEPGHRALLAALDAAPLLDLDLRLGEGTGAALAMQLIDAALRILHEMATFESAAVTDTGA
jgi:nicotinate-nucleotide--dimethylbenzimidazole phosphoribosyltransferase